MARGDAPAPPGRPDVPLSKQLDYDLFLLNGKAHEAIPPIEVRSGERVRLRLINAGNLIHTMHSHGHSFRIVATDGNPVPAGLQLTKDSVTLGPSERVDVELHATNPGVWMFHCHMEHHMANGMMTTLRYEGTVPLVAAGRAGHAGHAAPATGPPGGRPRPGTRVTTWRQPRPARRRRRRGAGPAGATQVVMTDNRFQPGRLTVPAGTTVTWVNRGTNVHTISAQDASFDSGPIGTGRVLLLHLRPGGGVPPALPAAPPQRHDRDGGRAVAAGGRMAVGSLAVAAPTRPSGASPARGSCCPPPGSPGRGTRGPCQPGAILCYCVFHVVLSCNLDGRSCQGRYPSLG